MRVGFRVNPDEGWAEPPLQASHLRRATAEKGKRLCAYCAASGVRTQSEWYRSSQLDYCTFHYWLFHGRLGRNGYSLGDYAKASVAHSFSVSLPQPADRERLQSEWDGNRRAAVPVAERGA